jgi:zinc transport system permease protein
MPDCLIFALLGGIGVALMAGPYGCFLVWRRMAFFGGMLAHGALLGIALGLLMGISANLAIVVFCVAAASLFLLLERQRHLTGDTILAIIAHGSLALGLVLIGFMETLRTDLMSYLFGDVLAVTVSDIIMIAVAAVLSLSLLVLIWRQAVAITVHEDLARMDGIKVERINALLMLATALVIAVAIKIVGILLVIALMIIPAATARRFAHTPEAMAVLSAVLGAFSVCAGLAASATWDTPAGPSVVVAALIFFLGAWVTPKTSGN